VKILIYTVALIFSNNILATELSEYSKNTVREYSRIYFGVASKNANTVKLVPKFEKTNNIKIHFLPSFKGRTETGELPYPENEWYVVNDPDVIQVGIDIKIDNIEKIVFFDNLANDFCTETNKPVVLSSYNFDTLKNISNVTTRIRMPCTRQADLPNSCPSESIVMVRLKTKDNKYFYNTRRLYTCIHVGTGS